MEPKKQNNYSISYNWTQPYINWPTARSEKVAASEIELAILDAIDHLVNAGLTSPEADAILYRLTRKG